MRSLNRSSQAGFNLIELMIVGAVAAIGLSIALPEFASLIARNRVAASTNQFVSAVNYARSEALRTNGVSGVCASDDQASCSGDWDDGYIIYTQDGPAATPVRTMVRVGEFDDSDTFGGAGGVLNITFDRRGMMTSASESFVLQAVECKTGRPLRRNIRILGTGAVVATQANCS